MIWHDWTVWENRALALELEISVEITMPFSYLPGTYKSDSDDSL